MGDWSSDVCSSDHCCCRLGTTVNRDRSARIAGDADGGSARYGGSVPAAEAALGVDDLAGDPGSLVGDQPGDQAGGVVGGAPASRREVAADDLVGFGLVGKRGV